MKKQSPVRIYTGGPPPGTPITPGTQIILSEGVAGGRSSFNPTTSSSVVSLPQHPLPMESVGQNNSNSSSSPVTISISR